MVVSCSHFIKCHYQYTIETVEKDVTVAALQARRETQMGMHSIVICMHIAHTIDYTVQTMVQTATNRKARTSPVCQKFTPHPYYWAP